ncbi:MAG TPA: ATP-dependent Clp protease proteolytic subunit [Ignavibacteria bacterium]|nr:ATP-dependent Clp protease proteolytic subunit [Ignavibacteria bacterium]HMR41375.1 ATP-dependent Clp protease proteolytic subunit [Ignavibacteria bacterium]
MNTNERKKSGALTAGSDQSADNYATEKNVIQVDTLNTKKTQEVITEINSLNNEPGEQELLVKLDSTGGYLSNAKKILDLVKPGEKVQLITKASGNVKPAGVVLTAGGKYGSRVAEFGTKFKLTYEKPYPKGTKVRDLSDDDKNTLRALGALTKRKSAILKHIIKGRTISANQAKKCNIIDEVELFPDEDWDTKKRIKFANIVDKRRPIKHELQEAKIKAEHPEKTEVPEKTEQPEETGMPVRSELPPVNELEKTEPNQIEKI